MLAAVKITGGIIRHSGALIADGTESCDIASSIVVWSGLKISLKPADEDHPYGHGKAEARTSWEIVSGADDFAAANLNAPGDKYCPNSNSSMTDAEIDAALRAHNETRQAIGLDALKWNWINDKNHTIFA